METHSAQLANSVISLQLYFFVGGLVLLLAVESLFPRFKNTSDKVKRDLTNLGLSLFNSFVIRFVLPISAIGVSAYAANKGIGVLNLIETPPWIELVVSLLVFDCAIYFQHRVFHAVPALWRLHRVHHMDKGMTTTTGNRFHPIEMLLSMLIKFVLILILGVSEFALILFFITLNVSSMFNHTNMNLPQWLDRILQFFIVTPDMHRIHHSDLVRETNSNYGFFLSIWDRLFNSYNVRDYKDQKNIRIGLKEFDDRQSSNFFEILKNPFV